MIVVLRYFFLLFVLKNDNLKKTFYVILKTQNLNFDSIGVLSIVQESPTTFGICKKAFKIPLTRFFVENGRLKNLFSRKGSNDFEKYIWLFSKHVTRMVRIQWKSIPWIWKLDCVGLVLVDVFLEVFFQVFSVSILLAFFLSI